MSRNRHLELLFLLGMLQAFAPVSIDMYLPAMPQMEQVFHTSAAAVQYTMVTFLVGFALGQSLYGPITDRFGRKPPLYASLALFIVSSAACALAPSIRVMSFFRLLQAIGACGGAVISRAIVRDLFPPSELRRIFSMLILVVGVSPVIAPLFGSYLLLWFGWKAAFVTQALIGVICLIGMHFRLPESLPPGARMALRVDTIVSAYSRLIKDKTFLGASVVCGFSSAGTFAYITSAPFVFISLYKVPTEKFGWLFGSVAAGMVAASQINGRMSRKVPLWQVLRYANLVQLAAGVLLLIAVLTGVGGLASVFACVFVYVAAQGFVFPNGSAIAMMRHGEIAGTASALLGTNQFLLAAIAAIFLGLIENPAIPMAMVIAACAAASTLLNFLTLGDRLEIAPQAV
ncbi:MAG: Bcr/CflA family drug resistance efflux transporter [Bryobacterales bacterium]|jgi:DHA1 family bicyclomycin/chloramphenicol resistance-like MFS transporter|nr:Bcr/CflA family drug resistance efflux transporter [Bryobacterales bacterium]